MAKFDFGQVVGTPGAMEALERSGEDAHAYLRRHGEGDWGDVCAGDKALNDEALVNGERLLSSYKLRDGTKVWVITECDRSATTILLPEEY